ncbi:MAG: glycerate kinase [Acidimicrobiales bacterium]
MNVSAPGTAPGASHPAVSIPRRTGAVVVAPDKFKGSLGARDVASHLERGLRLHCRDLEVRKVPVADGGDGTVAVLEAAGYERIDVPARGPTRASVTGSIAVRGHCAVVEIATAAGLDRLPGGRFAPLTATSYGGGELVVAALDAGCTEIVLALGGSACTDGGTGMAEALGVRFVDDNGNALPPGGAALGKLAHIDLGGLDPRVPRTHFLVASDVANPLLGPDGAAAVYGPQKGASTADVIQLEAGLSRLVEIVRDELGTDVARRKGAGAAGGWGYGAMTFLRAEICSGAEMILNLVGLPTALEGAALVITGEGSLDRQSLQGKAPLAVVAAALKLGVPAVAVAGVVTLSPAELSHAGFSAAYALHDLEHDIARCLSEAGPLLAQLGARIAEDHLADSARGNSVSEAK